MDTISNLALFIGQLSPYSRDWPGRMKMLVRKKVNLNVVVPKWHIFSEMEILFWQIIGTFIFSPILSTELPTSCMFSSFFNLQNLIYFEQISKEIQTEFFLHYVYNLYLWHAMKSDTFFLWPFDLFRKIHDYQRFMLCQWASL